MPEVFGLVTMDKQRTITHADKSGLRLKKGVQQANNHQAS